MSPLSARLSMDHCNAALLLLEKSMATPILLSFAISLLFSFLLPCSNVLRENIKSYCVNKLKAKKDLIRVAKMPTLHVSVNVMLSALFFIWAAFRADIPNSFGLKLQIDLPTPIPPISCPKAQSIHEIFKAQHVKCYIRNI